MASVQRGRPISSHQHRSYARSGACLAAAAVSGLGFAQLTRAAVITMKPQADAEVREETPEFLRGSTTPGDLSVRVNGGSTNHVALIRFDLAAAGITSSSQLLGYADLRLFSQAANIGSATNQEGAKIYGLSPTAPNATSWQETSVFYRDAGTHQNTNATGNALLTPSPIAQPSPGTGTAGGAPVSPIFTANNTYGANPSNSSNAPGLKFQYAPFSQNVENVNTAAYNNNIAAYNTYVAADLADDGIQNNSQPNVAYATYTSQPAYTTTSFSGASSDASSTSNGAAPGLSGDDTDPTLTSLLGYLNLDGKARPAGTMLSFSDNSDSPTTMTPAQQAANRTALLTYLTNALDSGATQVTFLVLEKISGTDPAPARGDNLLFAGKEFVPAGGAAGDFAAQLVVAPEPSSVALLGIAGIGLARRRRRA